jgi:hypothetical protein
VSATNTNSTTVDWRNIWRGLKKETEAIVIRRMIESDEVERIDFKGNTA